MRVNSINPTINYLRGCKPGRQKLHVDEPKTEVSFMGVKGGAKGGALGALAAIGLAALTGPCALGVLPIWTLGGTLFGHHYEEEEKYNKKNKNK